MALWIDTLCIPVAKSLRDYRSKAIVLLAKTYKDADAVLVLDRELEQLDTERSSLLEQELLMSFVGWMPTLRKSTFQTADPDAGFPPTSEISISYQRLCFAVKHRPTTR